MKIKTKANAKNTIAIMPAIGICVIPPINVLPAISDDADELVPDVTPDMPDALPTISNVSIPTNTDFQYRRYFDVQ